MMEYLRSQRRCENRKSLRMTPQPVSWELNKTSSTDKGSFQRNIDAQKDPLESTASHLWNCQQSTSSSKYLNTCKYYASTIGVILIAFTLTIGECRPNPQSDAQPVFPVLNPPPFTYELQFPINPIEMESPGSTDAPSILSLLMDENAIIDPDHTSSVSGTGSAGPGTGPLLPPIKVPQDENKQIHLADHHTKLTAFKATASPSLLISKIKPKSQHLHPSDKELEKNKLLIMGFERLEKLEKLEKNLPNSSPMPLTSNMIPNNSISMTSETPELEELEDAANTFQVTDNSISNDPISVDPLVPAIETETDTESVSLVTGTSENNQKESRTKVSMLQTTNPLTNNDKEENRRKEMVTKLFQVEQLLPASRDPDTIESKSENTYNGKETNSSTPATGNSELLVPTITKLNPIPVDVDFKDKPQLTYKKVDEDFISLVNNEGKLNGMKQGQIAVKLDTGNNNPELVPDRNTFNLEQELEDSIIHEKSELRRQDDGDVMPGSIAIPVSPFEDQKSSNNPNLSEINHNNKNKEEIKVNFQSQSRSPETETDSNEAEDEEVKLLSLFDKIFPENEKSKSFFELTKVPWSTPGSQVLKTAAASVTSVASATSPISTSTAASPQLPGIKFQNFPFLISPPFVPSSLPFVGGKVPPLSLLDELGPIF